MDTTAQGSALILPGGWQMTPFLRRELAGGGKVGLWPWEPEDARWLAVHMNDAETTRYMVTGREPISVRALAARIATEQPPADHVFRVGYKAEAQPIFIPAGYVGLWSLDSITRKAEYRILLGPDFQGQGIGKAATKLILYYGFKRLGLQRIWLGVTFLNEAALRCYTRCGFKEDGRLERDLFRDGTFHTSVRMRILVEEFKED